MEGMRGRWAQRSLQKKSQEEGDRGVPVFTEKSVTLLKGREEIRVAENSALLTKKIPKFRRYLLYLTIVFGRKL